MSHQFTLRPGLAYEFRENTLVISITNSAGSQATAARSRSSASRSATDLPIARFLYLRAGAAMDWRTNFAWTTGLGFYPRKGLYLDLAYQNDMFPEVQREFGHSRTLNVSMSWQF